MSTSRNAIALQKKLYKHHKRVSVNTQYRTNLCGGDMRFMDLAGMNLRNINLSGCDLSFSNLAAVDFSYASLKGANLSWCTIDGANFNFTDLRSVDFTGSDIAGASFSGALTERNDLAADTQTLRPLISVYMPTWNREDLAIRAINSIIAQDYTHWELIVIDDFSPSYEKLNDYIEQLADPRIHFIRNEFNSGACAVRNQAINLATGYLITGIDDDDEWLPNRLSSFLEHQQALTLHGFLYADDYICDTKQYSNVDELRLYPKPAFTKELFNKKNIIGNQMFTLTSRLKEVLFDTQLLAAQDYDAFYRLADKFGSPLKVEQVTQVLYVNHGEVRITGSRKKFKGYLDFYRKHKNNFDKSSRKYQLFTLYYIRNKPMGLKTLLKLMTLRNAKRYAMLFTGFRKKKF